MIQQELLGPNVNQLPPDQKVFIADSPKKKLSKKGLENLTKSRLAKQDRVRASKKNQNEDLENMVKKAEKEVEEAFNDDLKILTNLIKELEEIQKLF